MKRIYPLHDELGYVGMKDSWVLGEGDIEISNDARVSFDKESLKLTHGDIRLIGFLGNHDHTSPFRHSVAKFEIYAPLMVARQWWKYIIGAGHDERLQDPFTAWNESSRRYITEEPEFFVVPADSWRQKADKQSTGNPLPQYVGSHLSSELRHYIKTGLKLYNEALAVGVTPEQARLFLPAYGLYVRWRWTTSLQTVAHFINQRLTREAQGEIRQYAKAVYLLTRPIWEHGLAALLPRTPEERQYRLEFGYET